MSCYGRSISRQTTRVRPALKWIAKKLSTSEWSYSDTLSQIQSEGWDILWDVRFGNYGQDAKRRARTAVIFIAFHAHASGKHPRSEEATTFDEFYPLFVVEEILNPRDRYLCGDLLEDVWRRMDGRRAKPGKWCWDSNLDDDLCGLVDDAPLWNAQQQHQQLT